MRKLAHPQNPAGVTWRAAAVWCWRAVMAVALLSSPTLDAVEFPLRWRWSNPAPHGGNVVDMAYSATLGLAVQVAERGQIYTSDDLSLWLPRDSHITNSLRAVTFFGQRIIVTGENGLVLYADDPSDFQPGTLVDGPTTDWLEAVTASGNLLVAAGDNGAVYTSTNGVSWKRQNSDTKAWFRGVAHGAGTFVAVGEVGAIYTSSSATSWNKRSSPTSQHLNRVSFGAGRFTAVGNAGVSLFSTNGGANWFPEISGATNALQYAASAASGGGVDRLFDGNHEVRLQEGGTWSDELAKTNGPPDWTYYAAIARQGFFLIAGQSGLQSEGYQTNETPYFWLTPYDSVRSWLWDVMHLPGFYVAVGDYASVMTSGEGVDWTLEVVPPTVANATLLGVGGTTNLLLAVGSGGAIIASSNRMVEIVVTNESGVSTQMVSTLGVVWEPVVSPTTNDLQGVAALSNSLYVVTGSKGTILASTDSVLWTPRFSGTSNLLSSVTEWPGGLAAVGDNGTIITSADANVWIPRVTSTSNWLFRIRWLDDTLVAVGQSGTILTSSDGVDWSNRTSGTTVWLTDVERIEDTWFVVGYSGTVLTSTNLINWVDRGTITKKPLYAAATDARQLIVVGVEGVILRSPVAPDLTPVSFLAYDRVSTNAADYNVFLFGGKADQRFTLDRQTNLVAGPWTTGPQLEIFDGSGTLYFVERVSGTNVPPAEYYRTTLAP